MTTEERQQIEQLLSNPDDLLKTKPDYRGVKQGKTVQSAAMAMRSVGLTDTVVAELPSVKLVPVSMSTFVQELDVYSHKVLFDENVPSITIKSMRDGYLEIEQYRMAVPFQILIRDKQVRHLCVNPMCQTLLNSNPTEKQSSQFVRIKQAWAEKNMEGAKTAFVQNQKSYAEAALLFGIDANGKLYTRNINFADGYKIITHKNDSGKHILECLYYAKDDIKYIDCYDDELMTRFTSETYVDEKGAITSGWKRYPSVRHGFSENPLITKRGEVAWNRGQSIIESYEALYNTFIVIQKRHGWGIIYIKGRFNETGKKLGGNVVLNDTSMDANADAKILDAPDANNMIETLKAMKEAIEIATGTTFILPEDIKISGDASGLAIEMTQELDLATAQDGVIEWQNVANKMMRLFVEGLSIELANGDDSEYANAYTDFKELRIHNEFMVWKPKSEEAHNQMLATMKNAGLISRQTSVEKNTISTPDEMARIKREIEESAEREQEQAAATEGVQEVIDVNE